MVVMFMLQKYIIYMILLNQKKDPFLQQILHKEEKLIGHPYHTDMSTITQDSSLMLCFFKVFSELVNHDCNQGRSQDCGLRGKMGGLPLKHSSLLTHLWIMVILVFLLLLFCHSPTPLLFFLSISFPVGFFFWLRPHPVPPQISFI